MTQATLVTGGLITMIGSGAFLVTSDLGALLPVGLGVVLVALGWLGRTPARQALAGHLAVGCSFAGMVFSASAAGRLAGRLAGDTLDRPGATVAIALTGVVCLIHVTMSIRWFLARRRSESA